MFILVHEVLRTFLRLLSRLSRPVWMIVFLQLLLLQQASLGFGKWNHDCTEFQASQRAGVPFQEFLMSNLTAHPLPTIGNDVQQGRADEDLVSACAIPNQRMAGAGTAIDPGSQTHGVGPNID